MALGDIFKKKIPTSGDGKKIRELTGADTIGDFTLMTLGKKPIRATTSTPQVVDVIAPTKKYASIGTSQMRSGRRSTIKTSSSGLLSSASIGKKTLLGG